MRLLVLLPRQRLTLCPMGRLEASMCFGLPDRPPPPFPSRSAAHYRPSHPVLHRPRRTPPAAPPLNGPPPIRSLPLHRAAPRNASAATDSAEKTIAIAGGSEWAPPIQSLVSPTRYGAIPIANRLVVN